MILTNLLVLIIILFFIATISAPHFIKSALQKSFTTVQMKLFSPISLRGILLNGPPSSWGLEHLTIYISSISFGINRKKFKLQFNIQNVQIYCTRKMISFFPINLTDGFQQPNILFNFIHYISNIERPEKQQIKKEKQKAKKTFHYFYDGVIHLIILLFMHIVQVNLIDFKMFIVSGFPKELAKFQNKKQRKETLMLMQCLSEFTVNCDKIAANLTIEHHQNYRLIFTCQKIICNNFQHWKNLFFQINKITLQITIPFSLSIEKSYQQLIFNINIKNSTLNIVPTDFDHFFQFIKQMIFNPFRQQNREIDDSSKTNHKIGIVVQSIKINFEQIYQIDYDNNQAKQYLSNINSALLTLQNIVHQNNCFSVQRSSLSITKFSREQSLSRTLEVLMIPNLVIKTLEEAEITQITHDEVTLDCYSQQIALLGKIFSLMDSRIRFQNYNQDIYKSLQSNYIKGSTLIGQIQKMLGLNQFQQLQQQQFKVTKKSKVIYTPKTLTFYLQMKKLRHSLTVQGFSYTRYNGFSEMSHQIIVDKLIMEYKQFKQFVITNFKLTYSLTAIQDHLTIAIKDIIMNQNKQTLIDYLDSFTLFKHLLQFQSDQEQKIRKFAKKNVSIEQILLNFGKQNITIKLVQIDKQTHTKSLLNNLYFSLQNCNIHLSKLRPQKRLFRNYVNNQVDLFSFVSFSLKKSYQLRYGKLKQNITIVLKDPIFTLPQTKIADRVITYMKMFSSIESHLKAYINNVSNQKLKSLKYTLKQFLQEPPYLTVLITKLKLAIAQNKINNTMLGFSRTVREQLSNSYNKDYVYNQVQLINILKRNNKNNFVLLDIAIEKIRFEVSPIQQLLPFQKDVKEWINVFQKNNIHQKKQQNEDIRMKNVRAGQAHFKIKNLAVKIRDYPAPIATISQINFVSSILRIKKIFGQKQYYLTGILSIETMLFNIGLGQLSGFIQIGKRLKQFNTINEFNNTKGLIDPKQKSAFIYKIFEEWKWNLQFRKQKQSAFNIYTGNNPYQTQMFQLNIGKINARSRCSETKILIQKIQLNFKQFSLFLISKIVLKFILTLKDKQFLIGFEARVQDETQISISKSIFHHIHQLSQLQRDWLLIYGIYEQNIKKKNLQVQDIQQLNYLQIASLLLNKNMNKKGSKSFLNMVSQIKCNCHFSRLKISLIHDDLQFSIAAFKVSTFTMIKPNHDLYNSFQVIRSNITITNLIALFSKKTNNLITETIVDARFTRKIQSQLHKYSRKVYHFLNCSQIIINFNWYFVQQKMTGRSNVCIAFKEISGQISKKLQYFCQKIANEFSHKSKSQSNSISKAMQKPINKFRKAVLSIISINRRNKIKLGHIKKFKVVVDVMSYSFKLTNDEQSMILSSKHKASFYQSTQFRQSDQYHANPEEHLLFVLPKATISIKQAVISANDNEIMQIGKLQLSIYKVHEIFQNSQPSEGHCQFEDVKVTLSLNNKILLSDLIEFIVSLANTSSIRRRIYRQQTQKYSELINRKVQKLKEKIKWNQSDLKANQTQIFRWIFSFNNLQAFLQNKQNKFLSAYFTQISMNMNIFTNTKIQQHIKMKRFLINNELQEEESDYRRIIDTTKEGVCLQMVIETFDVKAFSQVIWKYFKEIKIFVEPLKIKMTEQLAIILGEFFDKPQKEAEQFDELDYYKNKTPDYFKLLTIQPLVFQLWLRSQSVFKRMEGIRVQLGQFSLKQELYTKIQILRTWKIWIIKQMAGQIVDIIGQKVLGSQMKK